MTQLSTAHRSGVVCIHHADKAVHGGARAKGFLPTGTSIHRLFSREEDPSFVCLGWYCSSLIPGNRFSCPWTEEVSETY